MRSQRGQANVQLVTGIVVGIVALFIGVMLTSEVYDTAHDAAADIRIIYTDNTTNANFTDNADIANLEPFGWDNLTDGNEGENLKNRYDGTNNWIFIIKSDNGNDAAGTEIGTGGDNTENSWWTEAVTVATIRSERLTATLSFKTRVIDNDNAQSIMIKVYMDDGTDNELWWTENATFTESATWTSHENNLKDNITAAGTYRVWLVTQINPDNGQIASNIVVGWDDVKLEITNHTLDYAELSVEAVGDQTPTVYKLAAILLLVIVAFAILKMLGAI